MTGVGDSPKDFRAFIVDTRKRLVALERRQSVPAASTPYTLPDRLGVTGDQVTDWNQAIEPGFYWSETAATNNPVGNIAAGQVTVNASPTNPRILQEVYRPSTTTDNLYDTWRRATADLTGATGWTALVNIGATSRLGVRSDVANMKVCSGTFIIAASVAAGGASGGNVVTFPAGFFSAPPVSVFAMPSNGRLTPSIAALTATSVTVNMNNWSPGATPASQTVWWTAFGVGP